jgi:site-specific DNA-methyltransferase (adenine-specific)
MNVAYNMDCLDGMKQLPDNSVDLTVTSPPYDNLRDYNGYSFDWRKTIKELYRVTADGGVVVWIVADATIKGSETGTSFRQALWFMDCGFNLHDTMIWKKPTFTATGSLKWRYAPVFEYMFVFSKGKVKTFHPIKDKPNKNAGMKHKASTIRTSNGFRKMSGDKIISEFGQRENVWSISPCNSTRERTGHPAQFPEQLAQDHIISWSNEGDTVLDPFLGSGTTRIAAYDLSRNFIGYEISKEYFDKQEERFARHTAQLNLFIDGVEGGDNEWKL